MSKSMFDDEDLVRRLAYLGQTGCDDATEDTDDLAHCRLLNGASAYGLRTRYTSSSGMHTRETMTYIG